jgi:mono/diheme cytochrome c family protein
VFHGRADGIFTVYRATDGERLWQFDVGTGVMAPPVTYTVGQTQYITVLAGWGGVGGLSNKVPGAKAGYGRILTFALDGPAVLQVSPFGHKEPPVPAVAEKQDPQAVQKGAQVYGGQCIFCHGVNAVGAALPDLRYSTKAVLDSLESIVLGGTRAVNGMPSFQQILTADDVKAIRAYIIARAQESAKPAASSPTQ